MPSRPLISFTKSRKDEFQARPSVDGALCLAVALCAPGDGIVPESVLLANGALLARGSGHVRGANTVAGLFIAPCCGGTSTLLAVWVSEEVWLASGALSPDDVWLALALTSDGSTLSALRTRAVAVAVQSTLVEVRS